MVDKALPPPFAHLERFVERWDHPGTNGRYTERLNSAFSDLQEFHKALGAELKAIKAYLDAKTFENFEESDRRLARLAFAWPVVAEAVEVFKQPRVPDSKMYWDVQVEPEF